MSNILTEAMTSAKNGVEAAREGTIHAVSTAKDGVESAREGTMHTAARVLSLILKGATATAGIVTTLRELDRDAGLAWFGLARRRSPVVTVAIFGAGAAVGAGIALLFAPTSGADLRRTLLGHSRAESVAKKVESTVEGAAKKVESTLEGVADHAVSLVKGAAEDAKHAIAAPAGSQNNGKPAMA